MSLPDKEWRDYFHLFEWENNFEHCGDWFLYRTPAAEELLHARALSYNVLASIGAFQRAFSALKNSGEIRPVRQTNVFAVEDEVELTAAEYFRIPSATVRRRYKAEPEFRASVDRLIASGAI